MAGGNIEESGRRTYNLMGVLAATERKEEFVGYRAVQLSGVYQHTSVGVDRSTGSRCFGKVVKRTRGEGSAPAWMIPDVVLGELGRIVSGRGIATT